MVAYVGTLMTGGKKAPKRRAGGRGLVRETSVVVKAIASAIERDGAYPRSALAKDTANKEQLLEVFDALTTAGFEIGAKHVRRPLEKELENRLRDPVALRALEKELHGATPREAKDAAAALVERGRARIVARGKDLFLAPRAAPVLDAAAIKRLSDLAATLLATTRLASKKGAALLRSDVESLLAPFRQAAPTAPPAKLPELGVAITQHREASGLTSVPKLVRMLGGTPAREAVHAELLRGARAGRFELRPESGAGRLSAEDQANCIPGPQGSRLSWVRLIEESS